MTHLYEVLIFTGLSFLAPIVTAGGSMISTNTLHFIIGINLIKAAGLTSAYFLVNTTISLFIFRKDIVWSIAKILILPSIIGSFIGSLFLVRIEPVILLILMLIFSLHYTYKKIVTRNTDKIIKESFWRIWLIGLFAGGITGAALPGGGLLNSYFASRGFSLSQMFGTMSLLLPIIFVIKLSVMLETKTILFSDLLGVLYAIPFLLLSNILIRKTIKGFSKSLTDTITLVAMSVLSVYLLISILTILIS